MITVYFLLAVCTQICINSTNMKWSSLDCVCLCVWLALDLSHGKVVMINRQLEATLAKPVRMKQYVEQYWCTWKVVYSYTIRFASYPLIPSSFMFYHYIHMYLHTSNIFFQLPKEKKKESTFACQEIGTLSIKFYPTICSIGSDPVSYFL